MMEKYECKGRQLRKGVRRLVKIEITHERRSYVVKLRCICVCVLLEYRVCVLVCD